MSGHPEADERPVAVVSPLREELTPLVGRLRDVRDLSIAAPGISRFTRATLGGRAVVAGWTGDGRRFAREGLAALLSRVEVSYLVVLGVAGGLVPGLGVGAVVAAREVRDDDGVVPAPDPHLTERALVLPEVRSGLHYSSSGIVASAAGKLELGRRLAPDGTPAVVDLETATYARTAAAHGVPYVALRAVSDPADEELPVDFARFCDAHGHTKRGSVAFYAMTHPRVIPALTRLRQRLLDSAEALARAASVVIEKAS